MRMRSSLLLAVLALSSAGLGCRGPKSDCEGTLHSYESIIDGDHWNDFPDIVWEAHRKKFGDRKLKLWLAYQYEGARSFKFKAMNASVSGDICLVQTMSKWEQKIRGKNPNTFDDEYNSYTLHLVDGKWYMEVPGASKIQSF